MNKIYQLTTSIKNENESECDDDDKMSPVYDDTNYVMYG
jgi:hypothetical protein